MFLWHTNDIDKADLRRFLIRKNLSFMPDKPVITDVKL